MSKLQQLIAEHRLVKVTAADFNGKEFDGRPLEPMNPKSTEKDLAWVKASGLLIESRQGTDYAFFGARNDDMKEHVWAGPGDYLYNTGRKYNQVVVIPGIFLEGLLKEDLIVSTEGHGETQIKLERPSSTSRFVYGDKMFTEGAIRTLMALSQKAGTPTEIATRTGMTQSTVVGGMTQLKSAGMIKDGQSAFQRAITLEGNAMLMSNTLILPR